MRFIILILCCASASLASGQIVVTEVIDTKVVELREDSTKLKEPVFVAPQKPGNIRDIHRYIEELLVYPEQALARNVEGKVFVRFIVEADGSLSDLEILRGLSHGCDEEALRLISLLPNWIPGTKDGVPHPMEYRMLVKFKI